MFIMFLHLLVLFLPSLFDHWLLQCFSLFSRSSIVPADLLARWSATTAPGQPGLVGGAAAPNAGTVLSTGTEITHIRRLADVW